MAGQITVPQTAHPSALGTQYVPEPNADSLPIDHPKRPTLFETQAKRSTVFEPPAKPPTPYDSPPDRSPADTLPGSMKDGVADTVRDTIARQIATTVLPASQPLPIVSVCATCGDRLHTAFGWTMCFRCGYRWDTQAQPERADPQPVVKPTGVPLWVGALVAGCGVVVAANVCRDLFLPDGSAVGAWWFLVEATAGLFGYIVATIWAVVLTVRHWHEHDVFKFLDPTNVWQYALRHLPRTRWPVCLAIWAVTAFAYAMVLLWQHDFAIKDKGRPQAAKSAALVSKVRVVDEADTADVAAAAAQLPASAAAEGARKPATVDLPGTDHAEKNRAVYSTECVIIGYVADPADPERIDQLVLGARSEDGAIRYAGTVNQFARSEEVSRWVQQIRQLKPLLNTPAYMPDGMNAIPVDPSLRCQIGYAERTTQGVFKDTVVKGVGGPKPTEPGSADK